VAALLLPEQGLAIRQAGLDHNFQRRNLATGYNSGRTGRLLSFVIDGQSGLEGGPYKAIVCGRGQQFRRDLAVQRRGVGSLHG
jgi:hypothetical protein